ncbi:MAG: YebC/PmpR family DNA-binding transcriptional regulator [Caldithrix sp.]|nr:MAG: YebC/PmpR family DNA-binding transcriptional regulator [Caldithrix sp.]
MSGHSKWSTIKRKKGKADAERGKIFTRLIKDITVAARNGGGDETANPKLRSAVAVAKSANMPSTNIERAIKKGTGELPGVIYEEGTLEGYGPAGVALYIEILTDNRNRTVADVRHSLTKYGGNLAESGAVAWMFEKKGLITVPSEGLDEEAILMAVMEAGAEDLKSEEGFFEIVSSTEDLVKVKETLESSGIKYDSANLTMYPKNTIKVEGNHAESLLKILDALEDLDDVQNVYSNFDIDMSVLESME